MLERNLELQTSNPLPIQPDLANLKTADSSQQTAYSQQRRFERLMLELNLEL
jgi:hypothetical protein